MATSLTSIRLDKKIADEAVKALRVKTRTEAVQQALREVVATERFRKLMIENGGKCSFEGADQ